jgi:hypothetical protein
VCHDHDRKVEMDKMIKKIIGEMEWDELEVMSRKTVYELSSLPLIEFMEQELKHLNGGINGTSTSYLKSV